VGEGRLARERETRGAGRAARGSEVDLDECSECRSLKNGSSFK